MRVQSAVDGHGLVLVSGPLTGAEIDDGRLVEPFDIRIPELGYFLVYRPRAAQNRAFKLFRQWLRVQMQTYRETLAATG